MTAPSRPGAPGLWRVRDRSTFVELRRRGRRARHGPITVSWLPGPSGDPPRVAYAIGRRVGSAVARNRLRRRLRAIMGEVARTELHSGAYLVGADADAARLSPVELTDALLAALRALPVTD